MREFYSLESVYTPKAYRGFESPSLRNADKGMRTLLYINESKSLFHNKY